MKTLTNFKTWSIRAKNATAAILFLTAYIISMVAPFVPVRSASANPNPSHEVICHKLGTGNGGWNAIPPNAQSAHIPDHDGDFVILATYPDDEQWSDLKDALDARCNNENPYVPRVVTAPTHVDPCGTANDKYIIPTNTYAEYKVDGNSKAAGTYNVSGSVTITAVPKTFTFTFLGQTYTLDYVLIPPISWTFNFTDAPCAGSITIVKDTAPNSVQDFGFTATGPGVSNFTLDDDSGVPGASGTYSNSKTFSNLLPGTYRFTEGGDGDEWDLTDLSCTGTTSAVVNKPDKKVTVTLAAGQNVTCMFVNTERGKIIVKKQTLPDGNDQKFKFDTNYGNDFYLSDGETNSSGWLASDTYNVSEIVPAGWSQLSAVCDDGSPVTAITVSAGEVVTCTFTNTKLANLTIIKDALPNDSQDFAFTSTNLDGGFNLDDDSNGVLSNTKVFSNLAIGQTYTVTEGELNGWKLTNLVCSGGAVVNLQNRTISFTPTAGQAASCTYTNTKLATISGVKWNDQDGDKKWDAGEPTLDGWTINLTGTTTGGQAVNMTYVTGSSNAGSGAYSFGYLLPGTYTVTETAQSNWVQTSTNPAPVALTAGQTVSSVNFGNRGQGKITIIKKFAPQNDGGKVNLLIDGAVKASDVGHGGTTNAVTVWAGTHSASETAGMYTNLANYTTVYTCSNNQNGNGTSIASIVVKTGDNITCTFTNTRKTGTITVIKNVDDGYGHIAKDVKNWSWSYDGQNDKHHITTGSNNTQTVLTGTYTVSENQKDGYHVVASSCKDDEYYGYDKHDFGNGYDWPSTSEQVTVGSGENITCEFTNKRDTGTITVHKKIGDKVDPWGWNWWLGDSWNKQDMGDTEKVTTGWYWFGENQKDGYSFENLKCKVGGRYIWVNQGETAKVYIGKNDNVECTFTNSRDTGELTIVKDAQPNSTQPFHFTVESLNDDDCNDQDDVSRSNYEDTNLSFVCQNQQNSYDNLPSYQPREKKGHWYDYDHNHGDDGTYKAFDLIDSSDDAATREKMMALPTGWYRVDESAVEGWDLTDISCGEAEWNVGDDGNLYVYVGERSDITCTFTNEQRAQLTVVKDVQSGTNSKAFNFTTNAASDDLSNDLAFSLIDDGTGLNNSKQFSDLLPGTYTVTEQSDSAWKLDDIVCSGTGVTMIRDGAKLMVTLAAGAVASCTFVNSFIPQVLAETFTLPTLADTGTDVIVTSFIAILTVATALWVTLYRRKMPVEVSTVTKY